jgi:3-methylcrotonyl-CoA carboxylase beta subunit
MSGLGIPQVAIVAGPCTAGGAYTPTMSDEAIMVNKIGHVFLGGPPLVKAATGEVVTHEDLGGARLHTSHSGVADYFAQDELESFAQVRDIISGLNLEPPARMLDPNEDAPVHESADLDYLGGLASLSKEDVRLVIGRIVDHSRFSEFKAPFGANLVTGFAKLCKQVVGICANAGRLSPADGQKGAHFLQLCDGRDIPVIFLQNNGGVDNANDDFYQPDQIKESAKFAHVSANLGVPKVALNIGGLGGVQDHVAMCGPSFGARFYLAWPRARYSKHELKPVGEDKDDFSEDSAQFAASRCTIDGVILPRETRAALAKSLQIALYQHWPRRGRALQQNSVLRI